MLTNQKYIGEYHWCDVKNDYTYLIVEKTLFGKGQKRLEDNASDSRKFSGNRELKRFYNSDRLTEYLHWKLPQETLSNSGTI